MIIVDAGGGTVDVSSYRFLSTSPISVEEVTSPECESFVAEMPMLCALTTTVCRHPSGLDASERSSADVLEK